MQAKGKSGIIVLTCSIMVSIGFWYTQNETNLDSEAEVGRDVKRVVADVSDKYQVHYTSIVNGGKNPAVKINVDDQNNVSDVENYVKSNLSGNDFEHYEVDVFHKEP